MRKPAGAPVSVRRQAVPRLMCGALLLVFAVLPLPAQGIDFKAILENTRWSVRGTMLFFPEKNGNASAPMPILPSLGGAASYGLTEDWALELSLDVYGNTYDYDYTLKRVVPANDETRTAFVIGAIWGIQPVYRFRPMGDKFTLRAYGGLGIDTRIVFRAYGLKDSDPHFDANGYTGHTLGETRKNITSYFWGGGRFIFPFVGGGIDFPVMEDVTLGIDLRVWLPLWRIWTGENLPGVEGIRFGAGFRISFL